MDNIPIEVIKEIEKYAIDRKKCVNINFKLSKINSYMYKLICKIPDPTLKSYVGSSIALPIINYIKNTLKIKLQKRLILLGYNTTGVFSVSGYNEYNRSFVLELDVFKHDTDYPETIIKRHLNETMEESSDHFDLELREKPIEKNKTEIIITYNLCTDELSNINFEIELRNSPLAMTSKYYNTLNN